MKEDKVTQDVEQPEEPKATYDSESPELQNVTYVAVYGTLRQGQGNHGRINQDPICEAQFHHKKMFSLGGFPIVIQTDEETDTVVAEVYALDEKQLASCDRLEGHPDWYERKIVANIQGELVPDGKVHPVWMYIMPDGKYPHAPHIPSGDWLVHVREG